MVWLDANRFFAALLIVLIHSTTDAGGQPFAGAPVGDRIVPVLLRTVAETSSSEMFFVFSLFLIAAKLDRENLVYGQTVASSARRLLIPFAAWTVFYAFFRLVKAGAFGYSGAILGDLADWHHWVAYFVLGSAQYHLHFLPTLFSLVLLYPAMRSAVRYPIIGLGIFVTLAAMDFADGWIWREVQDPMLRDYLLRFSKTFGYVGYGLAAFSLYGIWKRGIGREDCRLVTRIALFAAALAFLVTLIHTVDVIQAGQWLAFQGATFWAHLLMPLAIFMVFMGSQYLAWPAVFSRLAGFTFGIYLIHPIVIDAYDSLLHVSGYTIDPTAMVLTKYALALPLSLTLAYLVSRVRALAWLIGLGPLPFAGRHKISAATPVVAG